MSIKNEIEKLREKVDKDPNSKLFVPLAEEYRKEGMTDEAISVLQKGLERQPGYMSARVSLGKIYLEKGQMDEARAEFESVIKSIPDNLYAHKKLAEIYRDTGERDLAIKAFRTVLKLNPMDEGILSNLRDIEGASAEQPAEKIQEIGISFEEETAAAEEIPFEAMSLKHTSYEKERGEPEETGEELNAFKESLFGVKAEAGEEIQKSLISVEEDVIESAELPEEAEEGWSFGEVESAPAIEAAEEEDVIEAAELPEEVEEELSFGDMADVLKAEGLEAEEEAKAVSGEMFGAELTSEVGSGSPKDRGALLQTADRLISEGKYFGAIDVYKQILAAYADDKHTLQRIEELRSLLKLLGKDKEVLISKLNAFLGAIKKRGDEFHRRT